MSISTTSDSNLDPEARPSTATEEELQLQIALTLSREKCKKAEEMKKSDDARLQLALEESQKFQQVDCRATSTTPQLSALSSDPFAAWKNPAASVSSVSLMSSNSINLLGGYEERSNEIERLALNLNNNCAVIPSTNEIPAILNEAQGAPKSEKFQHSKAKNAVFFEAIALVIHMDSEPRLSEQFSLCTMSSNET